MFYYRNRINPNYYRYPTNEDREKHIQIMDELGFEPSSIWESKSNSGLTHYFAIFKEIGKA